MNGRCSSVLYVGGNWSNGANAGLSYWNSNNDLSNSNTNIGSRLAYQPSLSERTMPLGRTHQTNPNLSAGRTIDPNVGMRLIG